MTQEEERLLFVDICARTPYNIIVRNIKLNFDGYVISPSKYQPLCVLTYDLSGAEDQGFSPIEDIRPYLRPMTSMTSNEKAWYDRLRGSTIAYAALVDWLNANHFDYRGLIEKELALEAPTDMYNPKSFV